MTLQQQALEMERSVIDCDERVYDSRNGGKLAEFFEEELRKAFRAGQTAALDSKGIQTRLDIIQEVA